MQKINLQISLVLIFLFLIGCGSTPAPVSSITRSTETLLDPDYELLYPADWKISNEENNAQKNIKTVTYKLRHPKNRDCLLGIDVMRLTGEQELSDARVNEIITIKVRDFQKIFKRGGYKDFFFQTKEIIYNKKPANRLIISAQRSSITRTIEAIIVIHHGNFYSVYYQWFSPWGSEIRDQLKQLAESFRIKY